MKESKTSKQIKVERPRRVTISREAALKRMKELPEAKGAVPCHCSREQELRSICLTSGHLDIETYCGLEEESRLGGASILRSLEGRYQF